VEKYLGRSLLNNILDLERVVISVDPLRAIIRIKINAPTTKTANNGKSSDFFKTRGPDFL
jgi:hypothetical protein